MLRAVKEADKPEPTLGVKVIGRWATDLDGRAKELGSNERAILHALILSDGRIFRENLRVLLPETVRPRQHIDQALRNTLDQLRDKYGLEIKGKNPVEMSRSQPRATVDLWRFLGLVERKDYAEAYRMIEHAEELCVPEREPEEGLWKEVHDAFERAKRDVLGFMSTDGRRTQKMLQVREELLARPPVPGVEPQTTIGALREPLEWTSFAWRVERGPPAGGRSLPDYLSETLARRDAAPKRIVVVGQLGSGMTLTAISVYLRLTDGLAASGNANGQRTVLFIDPRHARGSELATDGWFEARLADAGVGEDERPIVIMPHADALFSARLDRLDEVLGNRIFRECDLLLCCNEQFHAKILSYKYVGTPEIRLTEWEPELQREYVLARYGEEICAEFEAWRTRHPSRGALCKVPLHLYYVLSLMGDGQELRGVERRWQLFEQVARRRMAVAGHPEIEDALMDELGVLAHQVYLAGTPTDSPIRFTEEDLRRSLRQSGVADAEVESRARILIEHTLLAVPMEGGGLRFDDMLWLWFFAARHLCRVVVDDPPPAQLLRVFGKFFSAAVMDRCEEILGSWLEREESIIPALKDELELPEDQAYPPGRRHITLSPDRRRIAREQIGHLLGVLADVRTREELEPLLDPDQEPDDLVRRGIAIGLSHGGAKEVADQYVQTLREERSQGGTTPQADTNIGVTLSFHGDQPFNPHHPGQIAPDPDPKRSIADLIVGLENKHHPGTWRIKLVTLLDLAQRVAPQRFKERIEESTADSRESLRKRLTAVLDRLSNEDTTSGWPELEELRAELERLPRALDRAGR
jgi:hypothetical protein